MELICVEQRITDVVQMGRRLNPLDMSYESLHLYWPLYRVSATQFWCWTRGFSTCNAMNWNSHFQQQIFLYRPTVEIFLKLFSNANILCLWTVYIRQIHSLAPFHRHICYFNLSPCTAFHLNTVTVYRRVSINMITRNKNGMYCGVSPPSRAFYKCCTAFPVIVVCGPWSALRGGL